VSNITDPQQLFLDYARGQPFHQARSEFITSHEVARCSGLQDIRDVARPRRIRLFTHVSRLPLSLPLSVSRAATFHDRIGAGLTADFASLGFTRSAQTMIFRHRTPVCRRLVSDCQSRYCSLPIVPLHGKLSKRPVGYASNEVNKHFVYVGPNRPTSRQIQPCTFSIHKNKQNLLEMCKTHIKCNLETRKLCYRKDDRPMRPTYGCPENFRDSLTTSTATIPNIFMGFCSGRPYECSYKI